MNGMAAMEKAHCNEQRTTSLGETMSVSDDIEVLFVEIKLLELEIKRKRNRIETLRKQEKENK